MLRWKARVERVQRRTACVSLGRSGVCGVCGVCLRGRARLTEEEVLEDDGLLSETSKVSFRNGAITCTIASGLGRLSVRGRTRRLLFDARPCQVHIEQQQQDAEADDGRIEAVVRVAHEGVVEEMSVDLFGASVTCLPRGPVGRGGTGYLGLDEDHIDEEHDKVMLDILVAEATTVLTHRQPDVVAAARVPRPRVLRPQRLDGMPTLDTDGHLCDGETCVSATILGCLQYLPPGPSSCEALRYTPGG